MYLASGAAEVGRYNQRLVGCFIRIGRAVLFLQIHHGIYQIGWAVVAGEMTGRFADFTFYMAVAGFCRNGVGGEIFPHDTGAADCLITQSVYGKIAALRTDFL
jgi:hypothetical protein